MYGFGRRKPMIHEKKAFALVFWGLFLITGILSAEAQTAQQIAKKAFESTVLLVMEDSNGQPFSLGSGFLVRNGQIASNLHVVEGASRGYAKFVGQKTKYDIEGITGIDSERDLVLLKISAVATLPLSLGYSGDVEVGEPVYAVGNPQGLEGTFSQGIVSSIRQVGSDKLLQITAPISPGSSGGPVLNSRGEVIGMSVATFRGGQNLNFAIPSDYIKLLITKSGVAKPLTGAKRSTQQRSILGELGGRSTEGVVGGQLLWDMAGYYTFSMRNQLRNSVKDIVCLVVFYDSSNMSIEFDLVRYEGIIPAGLSKRVKSKVHDSIVTLTGGGIDKPAKTKIEFRVLDFQIVD
jgi:hypothetical protein